MALGVGDYLPKLPNLETDEWTKERSRVLCINMSQGFIVKPKQRQKHRTGTISCCLGADTSATSPVQVDTIDGAATKVEGQDGDSLPSASSTDSLHAVDSNGESNIAQWSSEEVDIVNGDGTLLTESKTEVAPESPSPKSQTCMWYDYGFQASFLRAGPTVPHNVLRLAFENFGREYKALRRNYLYVELSNISEDGIKRGPVRTVLAYFGRALLQAVRAADKVLVALDGLQPVKPPGPLTEDRDELRQKLGQLTLSNDAVWQREHSRPPVKAPWWILGPYYALCLMLDVIFDGRPFQRFWFLETVARMPYFSYISMLHLYETLGWWRVGAEVRKVHFAEEWNEMNHLKIMESLGGDKLWVDRFFAQHAAFFYYWILNGMFLISPKVAYNFSELIEMHAVDTYGSFVDQNEELLKSLPPPPAAISYYNSGDLYMFDEFQTSRVPESRRPVIESLYDVFCAIRDDEYEHVKTMVACQALDSRVESPHRLKASAAAAATTTNGQAKQYTTEASPAETK
eukprot:TRINITY_DN7871_c0_g2_i1.p1 TRINITY_DN7871_c0_g2~~TRINITY_DN7871_c0_g2_i1.p1  ORF type:complete len:599 (+),score=109.40 TRINITY_DN7871_c0_g2_i1:254-1798(+)